MQRETPSSEQSMDLSAKFGVVQGRLIQTPAGELQCFPGDRWEEEFALAGDLELDFIELFAERNHNPENPLWSEEGKKNIRDLASHHGLLIPSVCDDYTIDHSLISEDGVLDQVKALIKSAGELGAERFILPLFENGELNHANMAQFVDPLKKLADHAEATGLIICLETNLGQHHTMDLLGEIGRDNVKMVYDTGNRAAAGLNLYEEILGFGNQIAHVHLKDKTIEGENVFLGTGRVNFRKVFQALNSIHYHGPYVFETVRGSDPVNTAKFNIQFANFFIGEAQSDEIQ